MSTLEAWEREKERDRGRRRAIERKERDRGRRREIGGEGER